MKKRTKSAQNKRAKASAVPSASRRRVKKAAPTGGRRQEGLENVRSLIRTSGGASYAITLPRAVIRQFRWEKRQKLELAVDLRRKTILIKDWKK